jgi:pseudoazurin
MIRTITPATVAVVCSLGVATAADVEVKTLNIGKAGMMVFEPSLVRIAPGDTVHFVATDKGHNVETVPGMLPDGAAPIAGKLNDSVTVTFEQPGVFGVRCHPHYPMGMVALIVVGDPINEEAAKSVAQPGKARTVFAKLFETLDAQKVAAK